MAHDRRRSRGRLHAPPPPPPQSHRSTFGYWVPLVVTATLGLGALAAWIWTERSDSEDDDYAGPKPQRPPTGQGAQYSTQGAQPYPGPPIDQMNAPQYPGGMPPSAAAHTQASMPPPGSSYPAEGAAAEYYGGSRGVDDGGWYGQMRGYMKRTPSPQQLFESASKQVSAGMAAAGAALGSIIEGEKAEYPDDIGPNEEKRPNRRSRSRENNSRAASAKAEKEGFSDHERWSEEAEEKRRTGVAGAVQSGSKGRSGVASKSGRPRRTVAVIVSADLDPLANAQDEDATFTTHHASVLSHLPAAYDPVQADLFVLIYAPHVTSLDQLETGHMPAAPSTLGSSYSEINTPAVTPGSELQSISPRIAPENDNDASSKAFEGLYQQALSLVSHPSQILPFTTPTGYVHILRHLAPQLVYLTDSEALSGRDGDNVTQLKGWVGHTVLVVGDDGHGGLADTETEDESGNGEAQHGRRWYEHSDMVGFGKEVEVVDAARVGDDWAKRVGGKE